MIYVLGKKRNCQKKPFQLRASQSAKKKSGILHIQWRISFFWNWKLLWLHFQLACVEVVGANVLVARAVAPLFVRRWRRGERGKANFGASSSGWNCRGQSKKAFPAHTSTSRKNEIFHFYVWMHKYTIPVSQNACIGYILIFEVETLCEKLTQAGFFEMVKK